MQNITFGLSEKGRNFQSTFSVSVFRISWDFAIIGEWKIRMGDVCSVNGNT